MHEDGTVAGVLDDIRFHKEDYLIARLDNGVAVKGTMPHPQVGLEYEFEGRWQSHPRFGNTFVFDGYRTRYPTDLGAIRAYLQEYAKWVGPRISKRLVEAYGEKTLHILKDEPERVACEVKGITPKRALEVSDLLRKNERAEALQLELKRLFDGTRIPRRSIGKMVSEWGDEVLDKVHQNPYRMIEEIDGIGFLSADRVAQRVGFDVYGKPRVQAGIVHVLKEAAGGEGHTCLPPAVLVARARELLGVSDTLVSEVLAEMLTKGLLASAESGVYLPAMFEAEHGIASKLKEMMSAEVIEGKPVFDGLMEDQVEALKAAMHSPVFILTGGPGCGKTRTCKALIESFPNAKIEMAGPTGKSAKRLYEQTGRMAQTIHRLLEPKHEDGKFHFTRSADSPLAADLIILDEVSMVDVRLMAAFLDAVKPGTRLVLVGDTYQLPSVGPGNVLKDLIESGVVPCQELTVIKRQEPGLIVTSCHHIKDGKDIVTGFRPETGDCRDKSNTTNPTASSLRSADSHDLFFIKRDSQEAISNVIFELVAKRIPEKYGFDPMKDVQVITPLREKTALSCKSLNRVFQQHLNPRPLPQRSRFKPSDKVINKRNNYELGIINGDIGYVRTVEPKDDRIVVDFENPDRKVELSLRNNNLELAYAITCHSYQGSEAPAVVIPIHRCFGTLIMQRNWIYTAVSRAQKVCILVGQRAEVPKIIARNQQQRRFTGLRDFLQERS